MLAIITLHFGSKSASRIFVAILQFGIRRGSKECSNEIAIVDLLPKSTDLGVTGGYRKIALNF